MKEQAPFASYQGVNKQGRLTGLSDGGVHGDNTVVNHDYELFPSPQGALK
jgi:hypothetical protein